MKFDAESVTVQLHEEYRKDFKVDCTLDEDEDVEHGPDGVQDDEEDSDPEDMGEGEEEDEDAEDAVEEPPAKKAKKEKGVYELSHKEVSKYLRPQHALVYASIQGRTLRDQHMALLDWRKPTLTVRHLIVAMSRATHGKFVHVLNEDEEGTLPSKLQGASSKAVSRAKKKCCDQIKRMSHHVTTFVEIGLLPMKKRGPSNPMSPDERMRVRKAQNEASGLCRQNLINEAKMTGLPPPVFTRGRPRKYTDEEALDAKRQQWKVGNSVYKERVKHGLEALKSMHESTVSLSRWSA